MAKIIDSSHCRDCYLQNYLVHSGLLPVISMICKDSECSNTKKVCTYILNQIMRGKVARNYKKILKKLNSVKRTSISFQTYDLLHNVVLPALKLPIVPERKIRAKTFVIGALRF